MSSAVLRGMFDRRRLLGLLVLVRLFVLLVRMLQQLLVVRVQRPADVLSQLRVLVLRRVLVVQRVLLLLQRLLVLVRMLPGLLGGMQLLHARLLQLSQYQRISADHRDAPHDELVDAGAV